MKILQLCHKPPRPAIDGGCIAMDNLTKGLLEAGHDVKVLCASTHKHPFDASLLSKEYKLLTEIEAVFVDTRLNFVDAFSNLITRDSYNISRFFSPDLDMALEATLKENTYDVIQLESLFMTPYIDTIRRFSKAKLILRSHNLEYKIWQRMARVSTNMPRRAYLKILARRLKEYESAIMHQVDGIATISPEDTKHFRDIGCKVPIVTLPFGIDTTEYSVNRPYAFKPSLFHLGAMDWMPNIEGIEWFLNDTWDAVLKKYPQFTLNLAGKASDQFRISPKHKNVSVWGEVESAKAFMHEHGIMVVPLLSGGGIRIKIIEGMAMGKVIISTTVGAEGIGVTADKNIFIADTPEEFVRCIDKMHEDPDILDRMSKQARAFVEQEFDNAVLTDRLLAFYQGGPSVKAKVV